MKMDSSFVLSDSSDCESLPELADLIKRPISKVQKSQINPKAAQTLISKSPKKPISTESQSVCTGGEISQRSKQRALKLIEPTNFLLSPLKESTARKSKLNASRKLDVGSGKDSKALKLSNTPSRSRLQFWQTKEASKNASAESLDLECLGSKKDVDLQASLISDSKYQIAQTEVGRPTSSYDDHGAILS
jgi:hypothetical protein